MVRHTENNSEGTEYGLVNSTPHGVFAASLIMIRERYRDGNSVRRKVNCRWLPIAEKMVCK
jgi:hypothetical protein